MESIVIAKSRGATLRVGPELEIPSVASYYIKTISFIGLGPVDMAVWIISWKVSKTLDLPFLS